MRFSVIIPLYNKEAYVRKALESVAAQTYKDFECIIVDDGSTDNSAAICEEYLSTQYTIHPTPDNIHHTPYTIRLLKQANSGVAAARNNGVAASKGEYVCFLDADDWWESTWLEEMDRLIQEYPDAGLYATNYIYYKPGKTRVALNILRGIMNYPKAYLRSEMMPVTSITTCMPRKVFEEMGGFPEDIKLGEDFLLWAKTALHYKVAYCEKPLAYYNNDVPANLRATRNLHAPEHHMLFHLDEIESIVNSQESIVDTGQSLLIVDSRDEWKVLLDKLRVDGLLKYWMDDTYHAAAAEELKKVDWTSQPRKVKAQYEKPIWVLRAKRRLKEIGSNCKQVLIEFKRCFLTR